MISHQSGDKINLIIKNHESLLSQVAVVSYLEISATYSALCF